MAATTSRITSPTVDFPTTNNSLHCRIVAPCASLYKQQHTLTLAGTACRYFLSSFWMWERSLEHSSATPSLSIQKYSIHRESLYREIKKPENHVILLGLLLCKGTELSLENFEIQLSRFLSDFVQINMTETIEFQNFLVVNPPERTICHISLLPGVDIPQSIQITSWNRSACVASKLLWYMSIYTPQHALLAWPRLATFHANPALSQTLPSCRCGGPLSHTTWKVPSLPTSLSQRTTQSLKQAFLTFPVVESSSTPWLMR